MISLDPFFQPFKEGIDRIPFGELLIELLAALLLLAVLAMLIIYLYERSRSKQMEDLYGKLDRPVPPSK